MNSTQITPQRPPAAGTDHRAASRAPSPLKINSLTISRPNTLPCTGFRSTKLSNTTSSSNNIHSLMLNSYLQPICSPCRLSRRCRTLILIRVGAPQVGQLAVPLTTSNSSCRLFPWRASSPYSFRGKLIIKIQQPRSTQQHQCNLANSSCRLKCINLMLEV